MNKAIIPYIRFALLLSQLCLIGSCATGLNLDYNADNEQELMSRVVRGRSEVDAGMLALDAEVQALIDARIKSSWGAGHKVQELRKFLYHPDELAIGYDRGLTKTAQETFEARSGNCLSLTSLFIAAARHVGVDAHFQTVSVEPSWDYQLNTLIRYEHVVATGRVSVDDNYVVDFLPEFSLTVRKRKKISDRNAVALYYNNIGGEQLVLGNTDKALEKLQQALFLDPYFSSAWNNIGAAYRRIGDKELAEFSYWKAISLDVDNVSALSNLARFYDKQNQPEKSQQFISRVKKYQASNPYFLAAAGRLLLDSGQLIESLDMLIRSIELKQDEPAFYLTIAEIYMVMGKEDLAIEFRHEAEVRRNATPVAPARTMNHRFWSYRLKVN